MTSRSRPLTLFLGGDVMTGRGLDQVLPHPGEPRLWESYVHDARTYVAMAEARSGVIPRPVPFSWPWGDALSEVEEMAPAARVINLETSITTSDGAVPGKEVHYRMHPANVPCLTAFRPDACVLANNHVLDFGPVGLRDTLETLEASGLRPVGAGLDLDEAQEPVVIPTTGGGRVLLTAVGAASSGVPADWAATEEASGVAFLADLSDAAADQLADRTCRAKRPGDVVVISIHWGSNWGYHVSAAQVRFAHRLIDRGVDVLYGHSSHHPRPIEVYQSKLILYGCGDLIDDYEGISGYEEFRDDLRLLYLVSLDASTGRLTRLTMKPMRSRRMRLEHASPADTHWIRGAIEEASRPFATRIHAESDGALCVLTADG